MIAQKSLAVYPDFNHEDLPGSLDRILEFMLGLWDSGTLGYTALEPLVSELLHKQAFGGVYGVRGQVDAEFA